MLGFYQVKPNIIEGIKDHRLSIACDLIINEFDRRFDMHIK